MPRIDVKRWRWRIRGAWLVPVFVVLTLVEAALLVYLPVWGDGPRDGLLPAGLLAACLNLVIVATLVPLAATVLRWYRRDLPRVVARDSAGTMLLCLLFAALLTAGLLRRGERVEERRERAAAVAAVGDWVRREEPELAPGLSALDTLRVDQGVYRVCVPSPLCVVVNLTAASPTVRRDISSLSNYTLRAAGG